jgi:hypothetical protein
MAKHDLPIAQMLRDAETADLALASILAGHIRALVQALGAKEGVRLVWMRGRPKVPGLYLCRTEDGQWWDIYTAERLRHADEWDWEFAGPLPEPLEFADDGQATQQAQPSPDPVRRMDSTGVITDPVRESVERASAALGSDVARDPDGSPKPYHYNRRTGMFIGNEWECR